MDDGTRTGPGTWTCPLCPQHESYQLAEEVRPRLAAVVDRAADEARCLFRRPDDHLGTKVFVGEYGETVYEKDQGAFHIYIDRAADWWQDTFLGAHEAAHRIVTEQNAGYWPDETLAIAFSLKFLRELGMHAHAEKNEAEMRADAEPFSLAEALNTKENSPGMYGRCFLIGRDLINAAGWEGLALLANSHAPDGRIVVDDWLQQLDRASRRRAVRAIRF